MSSDNQTWGYHPTEPARIFDLKPGEKLPKGWSDRPLKGQHPHDVERGIRADDGPAEKVADPERATA